MVKGKEHEHEARRGEARNDGIIEMEGGQELDMR